MFTNNRKQLFIVTLSKCPSYKVRYYRKHELVIKIYMFHVIERNISNYKSRSFPPPYLTLNTLYIFFLEDVNKIYGTHTCFHAFSMRSS